MAIPSKITGLPVISIGDEAFRDCTGLTSVTIPNSVTTIGDSAFRDCYDLTGVAIGNGVTTIGDSAFRYCYGLTGVAIGKSVTTIGDSAFSRCSSMSAITVDAVNSFYSSVDGVLFNKSQTTLIQCPGAKAGSYTIPSSVTSIGEYAFSDCSSLSAILVDAVNSFYCSVEGVLFNKSQTTLIKCPVFKTGGYVIPGSVTSFGDRAFFRCNKLTSVTIPSSVTSIGDEGFYSCTGLTSVMIGSSVTSIGDDAFSYCSSLTSLTIGSSVTSIGDSAFADCSSLTSVTIPSSVTSIGEAAFYGCTSLTGVIIPSSVTSIGDWTFSGCTSLTSVTIPSSVTSIGDYAFEECGRLTSVAIPDSVTTIGDEAFAGCIRLTSVTIPSSVTSIGNRTFQNCGSLISVTIPNSVTTIGDEAFAGCIGLTSVTIPNSVTSIGNSAFSYCTSLTSVTIPSSIASIGNGAFSYCTSLTSVTIPSSIASIGEAPFSRCSSLSTITVDDLNSFYSSVDGVLFNKDQTTLIQCPGGKAGSYTIPNSVTNIGSSAFAHCSSLTSVTIPNGVTTLGSWAFSGCSSLTSATIPSSVTSIGEEAFSNCVSLTSVTIPNGVNTIVGWAFSSCSSLTDVTIGSSVTSIGNGAFSGCTFLTGVYFIGNAPGVGSSVFYGDTNATVYYLAGTTGWGTTFGGRPVVLWHPQGLPQVTPSAGANGNISPDAPQTVNSGGSVRFTANPNAGYVVDQWIVDGSLMQNGGTSYTLSNIETNRSVQVTFRYVGSPVPTPVLTGLEPNLVKPGGSAFFLYVNGANFGTNAIIRWNGADQVTKYVNTNRLRATIEETLIAAPETVSITVFNPGPGGGDLSAMSLALTIADPATTPTITVGHSANVITIGWQAIGFKLQSTPVLPATNWQDVAGSETTNLLRVTNATGKQFYRLKK